jgi:hypothetical protein
MSTTLEDTLVGDEQDSYATMQEEIRSQDCVVINDKDEIYYCGKLFGRINETAYDRQPKFSTRTPGLFRSLSSALSHLKAHMAQQGYWPNIYSINDHGNVTQLSSTGRELHSWV